ncbi:hypothetical protein D0863_13108 [Hortaea werneckii]|uniref:F-box domain-containing protein n=1 Tax=Hortaea werneckii TaxID=91943 RepID=A0A3M7CVJ6_HORWE|nr:hypothetical protein D0863_13108 [Hortaea werneckii]
MLETDMAVMVPPTDPQTTKIDPQPGPIQPPDTFFRLWDLPSELRLRIYEYALAPTQHLHLSRTQTKPFSVTPPITPQLLTACHQIHREASPILLDQNEICIAVDAHDAASPVIPPHRLPPPVLQRIRHLSVILDCTNYFNLSYSDTDLTPFSSLTSLQTLRLAMVYRRNHATQVLAPLHIPSLREFNLVAQVLERIPAATEVVFGTEDGSLQREIVREVIERRKGGIRGVYVEAPERDLRDAAVGVKGLVRGCKSGRPTGTREGVGGERNEALTARMEVRVRI